MEDTHYCTKTQCQEVYTESFTSQKYFDNEKNCSMRAEKYFQLFQKVRMFWGNARGEEEEEGVEG